MYTGRSKIMIIKVTATEHGFVGHDERGREYHSRLLPNIKRMMGRRREAYFAVRVFGRKMAVGGEREGF